LLFFHVFCRYVTRLAEQLLQNLKLAKKLDYAVEMALNKKLELEQESDAIRPKINVLTKQTRELQNSLAKEISGKYNNRPVYITGGV